jgi:tetratricopeptide (TPR) repeat protein
MIAGIRKFVLTVGLVLGVGAASGQGAGDPSGPPVRELLADRRFAELETLMMDAEAKYRADHRSERQLDLVLDQFYRPIEWMEQPLTQWVDASSAVEARLGRGIHYAAMGWKRRGGAAASRTSEAQFDGMRDYHALAVEDFREVISRDPDQVHVYCYLIDITMGRGATDIAGEFFARALAANRYSLTARMFYLNALRPRWGGSEEAMLSVIDDSRALYGGNPALRILDGRMAAHAGEDLLIAGRYDEAIERLTTAIKLGGDHWSFYQYRGEARAGLNQAPEAIADFTMTLRLRPGFPQAYQHRGGVRVQISEYQNALADLSKAVELGRDNVASIYRQRAQANGELGRFAEARADIDLAEKLQPGWPYQTLRDWLTGLEARGAGR